MAIPPDMLNDGTLTGFMLSPNKSSSLANLATSAARSSVAGAASLVRRSMSSKDLSNGSRQQLNLRLRKTMEEWDKSWQMELDDSSPDKVGVRIVKVELGPITRHNLEEPDKAIHAGDWIMKCNGKEIQREIIAEIKLCNYMDLILEKVEKDFDDTASTRSNRSSASRNSRSSRSGRSSIASTASNFFRRSSSSRRNSSAEGLHVEVGDHCETISIVTVRAEEALESEALGELPIGTGLEIIQVGELPRRAQAVAGSITGWISIKTRLNEPLIAKRIQDLNFFISDFEVGGQHEVQSLVTLRAGESLDSEVITELKPGTVVRIKEIGAINKRRARVETDHTEGWISLTTRQGELLIGKVHDMTRSSTTGTGMFGSSSSKIKQILEAARCGDLEGIKKVVEGGTGLMGKLSGRPNLNCSDIRGKTALIYASAFGNRAVVEYLLSKKHEVDVNCMDDTQKSALHHASKRARKCRTDMAVDQARIVKMLIDNGALIEARDHNGCTPLMFAVANGDDEVAKQLLAAQANVNVKDYEGHTPLNYAQNFRYAELCRLLKAAGAEAEDEEDGTAVSEAAALDEAPFAYSLVDEAAAGAVSTPTGSVAPSPTAKPKRKSLKRSSTQERKSLGSTQAVEKEVKSPTPKTKAKPKGKAKGKGAKSKAKAKATGPNTMAMAAMVAEIEADDGKVEVLELKEEADEKELAFDKLKAIMASSVVASEIEGAIKVARAAGVDAEKLMEAEEKVKTLKQKAIALDRLRQAVDNPSVKELQDSIAEAEKCKVSEDEISKAKQALKEEVPRQNARDLLIDAQNSGDATKLKSALAQAKKLNLAKDELEPFEDLLKGAESKEKALAALKDAKSSKDVSGLKFAIQQAKDAGIDAKEIGEAEAILKEEEPKAIARDVIAQAMAKDPVDVKAIQKAIEQARAARLEAWEYQECEETLRREQEKAKALEDLKKTFDSIKNVDMTDMDVISAAKAKLSDAINKAKEYSVAEQDLNEFEMRRRKLHNAIEDLKGSIRVFCRVRPLSGKEKEQGDTDCTKKVDLMTIAVGEKQESKYMFDAVFKPGSQEEVYEECKDLVQSACDGYNVTLFAYGQTGAGKTYTMGGTPENPGVSRRTINEIFRLTAAGSSRYQYTVMGSMLELYRQDLVDLLAVARDGRAAAKKLAIRNDKSGGVVVDGLTEQECKNPDELSAVLEEAAAARKVMATEMNQESSRSHLLFIVRIVSVNRETHQMLCGKILIVDLAGSERLSKSGVTGEGAKEAIEINKSLTALGDVIEALTKNVKMIPYRNHKLTMVMADALGGSAKTLMFVNISPANSNVDETTMALKYATRAKKITNQTAKKSG